MPICTFIVDITKIFFRDPYLKKWRGWYHKTSLSPPAEIFFLLNVLRRFFFCGSLLLFMFRVSHAFLSVAAALWSPAGKGLTSLERSDGKILYVKIGS